MKTKISIPVILVSAVVALGVAVTLWNVETTSPSGAQGQLVVPAFSKAAVAGNIAFDQNCASCHGINALGSDKGPPLLHGIYNPGHHNDDSFYRAAARGTPQHHWNFGDMPPQPQLGRPQIASVIRYIRELQEANGIVWQQHTM